ncbi:Transcriptional regulator, AraC family [Arcticibacter svalbardensis MN12-7]|uniref:Transcriptional regulator, AraC family n=1 Tax=Arcticibacter svalbardensis MN12-7 TaxID=1150600 RepID=R9GQW8_9SPHI|nr:helix-turn-helix transcriptional regulator [Arcticibacter svalbardensis]EOR94106.1 Transcriptional regulator, AraC family [Arcticibacter svalbardensis MN12-7]
MGLRAIESVSCNASNRLTSRFIALLESQFPVNSIAHVLQFKTANDFASQLSVHVNHLNYAVKEVSGKTTSELIACRISHEAIVLLRNTDWNVAQIAYCLGFGHPANFTLFFKKQTNCTPKAFR